MKNIFVWLLITIFSHVVFAQTTDPVAYSLFGTPLYPLKESASSLAKKDSLLQLAALDYHSDSSDLDHIIWYGRRLAYLHRYPEAIEIYSRGITHHPNSPELYRHRGHRYITIRDFDKAIADFNKAAALAEGRSLAIEPDGIPNRLNRPLSNLHFNIYYHLGLAHYLKQNWPAAISAYQSCLKYSVNDDLRVATIDWLYMTYKRANMGEEAASVLSEIGDNLDIIENDSYYKRIKLYQGKIDVEALFNPKNDQDDLTLATQGYGVGNYLYCQGLVDQAEQIFKKVLGTGYWPAFGYLAAEAELAATR